MNKNVSKLYLYELKKIIKSRLVFIMFLLMLMVMVLFALNLGERENAFQRNEKKSLNGKEIDDALLNDMYLAIDDYGVEWNDDNIKYKGIAEFEKNIVGLGDKLSDYTSFELYELRDDIPLNELKRGEINDGEYKWWNNEKNKISTPITYYYEGGEVIIAKGFNILCVLMLFGCSIILSIVFVRENRYKTDQLIYTCLNGRNVIYSVKILAGLTVSLVIYLVLLSSLYFTVLITRGLGGEKGYIQLVWPWSAYKFTFCEYIIIQSIIGLFAVLFISVFVMVFSIYVKNSLAVIATTMGVFFSSQIVYIPDDYRIISQIISILPTSISNVVSLYDIRLLEICGSFYSKYSVISAIYLLLSGCLLIWGCILYRKRTKYN